MTVIFPDLGQFLDGSSHLGSHSLSLVSGDLIYKSQAFCDLFTVRQLPVRGFQILIFSFFQPGSGDFLDLILQKSYFPPALFFIYTIAFQLFFQSAVFPVKFLYFFFFILDLLASESVQDLHLLFRIKKRLVFMLPVDIQEQGGDLPDICRRSGFSVDLADTPVFHKSSGNDHLSLLGKDFHLF